MERWPFLFKYYRPYKRYVVQILFKSCLPNQSDLILTEWFNTNGDKELRNKIKTNCCVYSPSIIKRSLQLDPRRRITPYLLRLSFKHVFSTNIRARITPVLHFKEYFSDE